MKMIGTAGDRKCYVYFDMEFTGLTRDTSIISVGLVDCDNHSFYAELNDYDVTKVDPWILQNVIKNLVHPDTVLEGDNWSITGDRVEVASALRNWLEVNFKDKNIDVQFCSDVCHYDFVLLVDLLFGNAINIPAWISPCVVDINQELGYLVEHVNKPDDITLDEYNRNFIPSRIAFDISREEYLRSNEITIKGNKHNSLYDARVIRAIHQSIWSIEG